MAETMKQCSNCGSNNMIYTKPNELRLFNNAIHVGIPAPLGWLETEIFRCLDCGKLDFYIVPDQVGAVEEADTWEDGEGDHIAQTTCPACGREHDLDDPKCPFCGAKNPMI